MLVSGVASALILPAATRPAFADDLFCGYYSQNSAVVPQWARETPWSEGYVDVSAAVGLKDAKTFVRILGDQKKAGDAGLTPVLCLHGGPGLGFKYMDGLEVLGSEKERSGVLRPNRLRALALHIPWGEERINRDAAGPGYIHTCPVRQRAR